KSEKKSEKSTEVTKNLSAEKPYEKIRLMSYLSKSASATLVGYDMSNRLALYRFSPEALALKPISFAADLPKVGDFVISVGTSTICLGAGIVSAIDRRIQEKPDINPVIGLYENLSGDGIEGYSRSRSLPKVFQHDSRLDLLSLGTPLLNLKGELVGINVCKLIRGTCYAIPNEVLLKNIPLMKEEKIIQAPPSGRLGAYFQPVSAKDQINYGMKVLQIVPDSAAEKGGILIGDIILSCDGNTLKEFDIFKDYISSQSPGTKVTLVVLRDDKQVEMPITIGSTVINE
ncbi:MAG: S1C family serine protease, partial [Planctomycetota bacterium]